ncbi:MAG: response regulator transcription factor [Anaerolineae bacterium]|jgi:DNA-binding response OmpR family regulator
MGAAASILAVDDHPSFLAAVGWTLEAAGYEVLSARDGVEAVSVLESQPVDLILADIAMPRMNGYQLFQRVLGNPEWLAIPFVFVTGRAMDSDVRYGKAMGVDDYLIKPVDPRDLLAAVRGKLRQARRLSRAGVSVNDVDPAALRPDQEADVLVLGSLRINADQCRVWMDGERVDLSIKEFKLLEHLAREAERVVSHEALINVTHGLDMDRQEAGTLLRPLIRSVRRKLGYPAGDMGCIENVRGAGYMLLPRTNGAQSCL